MFVPVSCLCNRNFNYQFFQVFCTFEFEIDLHNCEEIVSQAEKWLLNHRRIGQEFLVKADARVCGPRQTTLVSALCVVHYSENIQSHVSFWFHCRRTALHFYLCLILRNITATNSTANKEVRMQYSSSKNNLIIDKKLNNPLPSNKSFL